MGKQILWLLQQNNYSDDWIIVITIDTTMKFCWNKQIYAIKKLVIVTFYLFLIT